MGNFSTKDNHGNTGAPLESFHTPPSSPQSSIPQLPPPTTSPALSPLPAATITSSGKKSHQCSPRSPIPPPDWRPPPPGSPNSSALSSVVSPVLKKTGSTVASKGQASSGRNGGLPTATPRTSGSQVKSVAVSPIKSPSSVCSTPPATSSVEQSKKESHSSLSESLLPGNEDKDRQNKELAELLEECRTTLGVADRQDGTTNTTEMLRQLLTEVKSLKATLQTERGEWLQFQADFQVAVSVADRLKVEAEEELTALRTANKEIEMELAAAQQRQKEAENQLTTLQGELKETRQKLADLTKAQDKTEVHVRQELKGSSGESNNSESKEGTNQGRVRGLYRLERERVETKSQNQVMKNVAEDNSIIDCKGMTRHSLRNVTNEDQDGTDVQSNNSRRVITSERSRSLSRLPASSDAAAIQNGASQTNSTSTLGSTNRNLGQLRGRKTLDWQDSKLSNDAGKREESLNKYNSALTELPPTKSQDGFNLLLRRHGGSKRNSLLRWCQSRTQGYKNIDITNFSSSWADGLAFCAVYHTYLPSYIPYSSLSPENKRENLSLAFKTGETVGISPSLTADEMLRAGGPDWQRVLGYVESIYRHFEITTLFLISGPEVMHAGSPTPIAVTVFADFSGNLTAEVAHSNTKVAQKGDFKGGVTSVLILPPFPDSLSQNSLLNLTVTGYRENRLLFTNTTTLTFNLRTVSSFIQTDRSSYKPGDTIKDPSGKLVEIWNSTGNLGIALKEFSLPQMSHPGQWVIATTVNLRIVRYDRKSLSSLDLKHSAVVQVTQRTSLMNSTTMNFTLPVPENGNVLIQFKLKDQVEMLFVQARFQTNEETLRLYTNYSSTTGSSIQISLVNALPAQIGFPLQLNVESTIKPEKLHFVVSSKGQVVAARTKNFSSSVSLTPELSWYPEACVTVFYIHFDGEITSDTTYISIHQYNHVTLNWSSEKAQPGEQVSLTVAGRESRFQVGVTVMAMQNDPLLSDLDPRVEQKCNLKMMTNAIFYMKNQEDGPKNEESNRFILEQYWNHWMETAESLLWLDTSVSDKNWTSGKITVPDGVTSLGAVAVTMSENLGLGFTPVPQKLTISKDFSMSLVLPSHLVRGEEIVLEINVINHLEQETEVIVLVAQSDAFEFVLMDQKGASVINAQKLTLGSHVSASAFFPIRALAVGEMEISVDAVSAETSDGLVGKIWVKPEGVEQTFSHTLFLEVPPEKQDSSRSMSFSFPPNLVPGSQRAHVALVGDILGLSIENLESLVQLPTGCGEQNMVHFAPSVYVLQYLEKSSQDDAGIRSKALSYIKQGYEKQLSYQRDDGSFSAFGKSDSSGSTWLTAFVLRCFLQAQPYIQINQTVLTKATAWLLKHQGSKGEFTEVGKLIHTEMQGGLDDSSVALTAYVLLAFLEDGTFSEMYADNVSLALRYLENKVSSGVVSNYTLCLVAYALALGKSNVVESVLLELSKRAEYRDGVMMWTISRGLRSNNQQQRSAQIEMASYVLLVLFMRGNFLEGITLMKWLSTQRNYLGGFGTTQDTVVALQVLSYYAAFSGANAISLRFNISSPVSSTSSLFHINSSNYRVYQSREINADKDLPLNIYMEGRGFAIFQLNIFYNIKSTQDVKPITDEDAFILDANHTYSDPDHIMLSVCTRLKDNQGIAHTGMAILEVGMLSGFSLPPGAGIQADFIRKVDRAPERVILYLDSEGGAHP
ncbi:CD109 antigen [Anableps anableps]